MKAKRNNKHDEDAAADVIRSLIGFRKRGRLLTIASGAGWVAAGSVTMLTLLAAALGWWEGAPLRAAGWLFLIALNLAILGLTVLRPLIRISNLDAVARRVGRAFPKIASDVLSASQLARRPEDGSFCATLLAKHLQAMADRLAIIPGGKVFPAKILALPATALAIALGGVATVHASIPAIMETGMNLFWEEPHVLDSRTQRTIARAPVVSDLKLTLRYPEYFHKEERRLLDTSGGFVAPLGTTAILEGRVLVPDVIEGSICLGNSSEQPLTVHGDGRITGRFTVMEPGSFSLKVGNESLMTEGPARVVEIEEDTPPTLRLLRPVGDVEVDEFGEVVLEFEGRDDHGISRIDMVLRSRDRTESTRTIMRVADRVDHVKGKYRWSPQSIRMESWSRLEMELLAYDDDTISGPKPGRARSFAVNIMTRSSRHESVLMEQDQVLDDLVDLLAARLQTRPPANPRKSEEARERFGLLRSQTEDLLGRMARLIHQMKLDPLSGHVSGKALAQIREDLSNQLLHEARLHRPPMEHFKKRQGVDRVTVRIIENAVIRIDDLIMEQQFTVLVKDGGKLEKERTDLVELIEAYGRTRSEIGRRAVLDAIEKMEKMISGLGRGIETVRGKVSDVYMNPSALEVVDFAGSLKHLRALLAQGNLSEALEFARSLEQKLARVMAELETGHLAFRTERFGKGEEFIGELLDRIMAIESSQLQLRRKTIALRRRFQEKVIEVMKGKIDSLVKRQLTAVVSMRQHLEGIESPEGSHERKLISRFRIAARELELALGQGDLDEARQVLRDLRLALEDLADPLDGKLPGKLARVDRTASRLIDEIQGAYPRPSQLFSDRDHREARRQSVKQRHLFARTKRLRTWIKEQSEDTRFLARQALGSLNSVATRMNDGTTHLEDKKLREALEAQTEALDGLARLRQDLRRGGETSPLQSRPMVLKSEVDIPKPEEFEVPPEYREDIIEAMRGDLPIFYSEAIKRYYEILVR